MFEKIKSNKTALLTIAGVLLALIAGTVVTISIENGKITAHIEYSNDEVPALVENDKGEVLETTEFDGQQIPTVESIDGGPFEDITTGVSVVDGEYTDLGWSETYNVSSPEAFMYDTLGKCIIANNYWGAQCVSLARAFWWSYADRDVSTCGTGMAKGMMNCYGENAGDDFLVYWDYDAWQIQAGDWLVFDGGQYGHVGMALGPVNNGYVALLGENQGGQACAGGGAATNIINISVRNLIGYYRPIAYVKPEPEPTPEPTPEPVVDKCYQREVVWGDTLGDIMKECNGKIEWGEAMDDYARSWTSIVIAPEQTVYEGWNSYYGVGLYAGDTIVRK